MLAKSQRLGVERRHHGGASRTKLPKQRAVVAGCGLVADCMTEEAVLVLDVDNVIPPRLLGDIALKLRDVGRREGPPEVRLKRVDIVANPDTVERPHEVAAVGGNPTGTIPGREVQYAHHVSSLRCPPMTLLRRVAASQPATLGGTVESLRIRHNLKT